MVKTFLTDATHRREVLSLATASVRALGSPPVVTLEVSAGFGSRRWHLIVPRTVVLEVLDFAIPAPRLSDPLPWDLVSISGRLVPFIPPDSSFGKDVDETTRYVLEYRPQP